MRIIKVICCASALFLAVFSARGGTIVTDSLRSETLSATVRYNVYLPDGYLRSGKTYPVIYLLHGLHNDYRDWEKLGRMKLVSDELMESGEACDAVIVMPNAGGPVSEDPWYGYFNMPGWNYEDFFFGELVPTLEKRYRIASDKAGRAVMGLSMGGGGSVVYCQKHPDMFSSCYAMSPWLDNKGDVVKARDLRFPELNEAVKANSAIDFVANADGETLKALGTVRWTIDCGDDDFLLRGAVELHLLMKEKGIKSELRVRNGVHNWEYWHLALRDALPFASRGFRQTR